MKKELRERHFAKRGAAIVELVLGMLLLLSMIAFSIFVCQALSQRNRTLAASRTVAWLYSHADDPEGKDKVWNNEGFRQSLAEWHFVNLEAKDIRVEIKPEFGLIAGKSINQFSNAVYSMVGSIGNGFGDAKNVGEDSKEVNKRVDVQSPAGFVAGGIATFFASMVNFITQNFEFCGAQVTASTPLLFRPQFYQMFGWFEGLSADAKGVMLNPSFCGWCYMPMQIGGEGVKDPLEDVGKGVQDSAKDLNDLINEEKANELYRPFNREIIPSTLDSRALYALLIYEMDHPHHAPLKTEAPDNWTDTSLNTTIQVTYHSRKNIDTLMDRCGYASEKKYEKGDYQKMFRLNE